MVAEILQKLEDLGNETTKNKYLKDGCDIPTYGVKVGDLKQLIKAYKLNKNSEMAIALIESQNFDAMYLGFLMMNPSDIDKQLFIKWSEYTNYYRIRIHSLAYAMAEHEDYQYFIDYYAKQTADRDLSIYYAILAGRIIIDPNYNNQLLIDTAYYIGEHINTTAYQNMPLTKIEMHGLIGYIGMQIAEASLEMIAIAETIEPNFTVDTTRRIGNNVGFIKGAIERNSIGKKRKSARC
ncbi:DNA alkylation repair protein [Mollicutes bacterium LVI A0039]|nr:DNA alkylation repair protein [Mollicutes bacterium LVI A0039]